MTAPTWYVHPRNGGLADVVTDFTDGLGRTISVDYAPLAQTTAYTLDLTHAPTQSRVRRYGAPDTPSPPRRTATASAARAPSRTPTTRRTAYGSSRPHAVTSIGSMSFTYDANGNMTDRNGTEITWASYNLPTRIERSSGEYSEFLSFQQQRLGEHAVNAAGTQALC